jgi:hypothetical protein
MGVRLLWIGGMALLLSCSGNGPEEGTGGTGGTGGSSATGGAAGSTAGTGGVSLDAGCVDFTACANCLTSKCEVELTSCDAVPGCLQAQFDQASCLQNCLSASSCWNVFEVSGGSVAEALRDCAKVSCSECQP